MQAPRRLRRSSRASSSYGEHSSAYTLRAGGDPSRQMGPSGHAARFEAACSWRTICNDSGSDDRERSRTGLKWIFVIATVERIYPVREDSP